MKMSPCVARATSLIYYDIEPDNLNCGSVINQISKESIMAKKEKKKSSFWGNVAKVSAGACVGAGVALLGMHLAEKKPDAAEAVKKLLS
jgi:hypothetical protein